MKNRFNLWKVIAIISFCVIAFLIVIMAAFGGKKPETASTAAVYTSNPEYGARLSMFELNTSHADVVFVGDSLTERANLNEFFPDTDLLNRGINSDTTEGVLDRISEVAVHDPEKVFLMIGVNDIRMGVDADDTSENMRAILAYLEESLPDCEIFVQSILPAENISSDDIEYLNGVYASLADGSDQCTYVDLYPLYLDKRGNIISDYYGSDGLHLSGEGYRVWFDEIEQYIYASDG
ncbi:MAG: GDSL-type esterase/lipase family protein [Clostridiales bacterium]|nr:GDSL-type esterase/lipase family protein [Clostridiales bacterium]